MPSPGKTVTENPEVLALGAKWLVLDKPAGWLTIPASAGGEQGARVLSAWARERYGDLFVVHRLDRETSGVVLFARTAEAHREANTWFQNHAVKKQYDCLAAGIPAMPVLRIKAPVRGAPSATQVEVKESYHEGFLARVTPLTGRRHQIRVHLSGEGHPLWGDREYRGPMHVTLGGRPMPVARVALHAARLELPTREIFEAPWPADFLGWVEQLRKEGERVR